jgi:hypothetical protein
VEAVPDLEDYLRTARIVHTGPLAGGGGHQHKQLVVLDGGLGVVAKLAEGTAAAPGQVRAEVAAYVLSRELRWSDLVPTTTLRVVRSIVTSHHVAASVQVALPFFKPALERQATVQNCSDEDRWRAAIIDALAWNTDRSEANWGFIEGLPNAKLIDNGNAFDPSQGIGSSFVADRNNQDIPQDHLDRIQAFMRGSRDSQLREILDEAVADAI